MRTERQSLSAPDAAKPLVGCDCCEFKRERGAASMSLTRDGKAEPFRTEGGRAAQALVMRRIFITVIAPESAVSGAVVPVHNFSDNAPERTVPGPGAIMRSRDGHRRLDVLSRVGDIRVRVFSLIIRLPPLI